MAQKRAVTKQQDTSRTGASVVEDPRAHLTALAGAFIDAIAQCVEDADADAVHRVRTGSRRLQAMLEAMLRENGTVALDQPAQLWLRQLKQIRRAAGPVRDLDVHRELLQNLVGKAAAGSDADPLDKLAETKHPETKQAEMLDDWLRSERKHLARGMQKQIRKRQRGLAERQTAVCSVPIESVRTARSADAVALEEFVRATDAMPVLDGENLHDFRKATKKARYVAESATEKGPYSSVAKALKRVQDAIGEWHDWLCLFEEGETALGKDAPELSAHLEREVDRHFAAAMKITQTMRARLAGEWMALSKPRAKRPVASVRLSDRLASGY